VSGEEVKIEASKLRRNALLVANDGAVVVPHHVRRVIIDPARLHEAQDEAFINVVLPAFLWVDRAVVEALVCDLLLVFDT
jgi:hypothetical protein